MEAPKGALEASNPSKRNKNIQKPLFRWNKLQTK